MPEQTMSEPTVPESNFQNFTMYRLLRIGQTLAIVALSFCAMFNMWVATGHSAHFQSALDWLCVVIGAAMGLSCYCELEQAPRLMQMFRRQAITRPGADSPQGRELQDYMWRCRMADGARTLAEITLIAVPLLATRWL